MHARTFLARTDTRRQANGYATNCKAPAHTNTNPYLTEPIMQLTYDNTYGSGTSTTSSYVMIDSAMANDDTKMKKTSEEMVTQKPKKIKEEEPTLPSTACGNVAYVADAGAGADAANVKTTSCVRKRNKKSSPEYPVGTRFLKTFHDF